MLYDKSIKNCKGEDKMNTKDYIENKKSKKLSNILKGALATGLVVGSMITSTACKPNQPHESTSTTNSSTSTIETTTTTQQTTTETPSTTETTKIDEPIVRTDEQVEKFLNEMSDYFKVDNLDEQSVAFGSRINEETGEIQCRMALVKKNAAGEQYIIFAKDINSDKFYRVYNELSKNGYWSEDELSEKHFTIKFLKENCSGEVLDIIVETAQDVYTNKQSTNQSSEDDLVR